MRLLQKYGTLENTLAHAAEEKGKLGEKLQTYADQARSCRSWPASTGTPPWSCTWRNAPWMG